MNDVDFWLLIGFCFLGSIQMTVAFVLGGKAAIFTYAAIAAIPALLIAALGVALAFLSVDGGAAAFGESIVVALMLMAVWVPVGVVSIIVGAAARVARRWLRQGPKPV